MEASKALRQNVIDTAIDNKIYNQLGERWYSAEDDPVALLRAESRCRNPWILETLAHQFSQQKVTALDVGCGGGFLSNALARAGHSVTGIDLSQESLAIAQKYDTTQSVSYLTADAYTLPFQDQSFDVVCAMDFLEHVEQPAKAIHEISRVLKPGGLFFFHTFNRNILSTFLIIKLVDWFIQNTPPHLHLSRLFIKPKELKQFCQESQLEVLEMRGLRPHLFDPPVFFKLLSGLVHEEFRFSFTRSLLAAYCGYAKKQDGATLA